MDDNKMLWNNINKLTRERDELRNKLALVTKSHVDLVDKKYAVETEMARLKNSRGDESRVRELEAAISNLKTALTSKETEVHAWRKSYDTLSTSKLSLANENGDLRNEISVLEDELDAVRNAKVAAVASTDEKALWNTINKQTAALTEKSVALTRAQKGARRNRIAALLMALAGVLTAGTATVTYVKGTKALPWSTTNAITNVSVDADSASSDEVSWQAK